MKVTLFLKNPLIFWLKLYEKMIIYIVFTLWFVKDQWITVPVSFSGLILICIRKSKI